MTEPTLLIVDDDPGTCETLSDIFQEKGYTVATATTGREAQDKAKQTAFNVALIDIKLPDVDGTALLTEFRKTHPDMACMIITGHASVQNAIKALEDGANGYFVKPLIIEEIVLRVEETVDKQRLVREKRRAEEELAKERDYTRHLIESSPDFQMILDKDGRVTDVNEAFEKIVGKSREELIGSSIYEYLPKEETEKAIAEIFEKEKVRNIELTVDIPGKRTLISNFSGTVFTTPEGKTAIYATGRDITEQRRAEEALWRSEKRFRDVAENAFEWIWEVDANGKYTYASPVAEKIIGYKPEELLKKHFYDPFHPEDREELKKAAFEVFAKKQPFREFLNRNVHKNGRTVLLSTSGVPVLDEEGNLLRYRGADVDITERKRAKDKIKASLKEKEVLLREIHHRVKNNLQIISSLLNMQVMKAKDKNVIDSLLDSRSRIQTMSLIHAQLYQSENLERIEMDVTIRKLVSFLSQIYAKEKKNITSVVTAEGVILSISQAIPCGLIINELVSNALKHAFTGMTKGGIEISMRELADDRIELTVKDNGVGIPEELDIYKTDTLGLKIVRSLAEEQLKGKMGLIRNEGTEIYVEFDKSITN